MPQRGAAPRDLLFGLLALQNALVSRDQLVLAFATWTAAPGRPLAILLAEQGALRPEHRPLLDALVEAHLKLHGGDPERSLAALDVNRSTRESLAAAGPVVEATLACVGSGSVEGGGADRTASYAAGTPTADGQRFRVLRPHASGGLGAVFIALDAELNREVAFKQILPRHADNPASRTRFLIEAEITGGLEHPGIVPVYGLGTDDGGRPYYAMRFIKGDTLKEAIDRFHADETLRRDPGRRSLELRQLLRRFTDVCHTIEYAHGRRVLHRDIKPANVIVGKHGETLVVDWGLAKPLGGKSEAPADSAERSLMPSSASGSAETLPGSALGTPAYMSPEQAAGELDRLGPRSDVYSLGATLYCLLTGKPPFEGDIGEVLRKVGRGEFPRPRQLDAGIDPALEAICLKAMATRPEERYPSCLALQDDVERWAADEPISVYRARRRCGWPAGRASTAPASPSGRGCSRRRWSSWPSARSCSASRGRGSIASGGPPRRPGRGPRRSTTSWSTTYSGRPTRSGTPPGRSLPCGSCSTGPPGRWPPPSRSPASPAWRGRSARRSATFTSSWGSTGRPASNCPGPVSSSGRAAPPRRTSSSPTTGSSGPMP